uniref:Uncharacterized protein n=1 Tax=Meloidogyne enterolobii TaxID=390850 RepID=A0A6V7X709_MELEN|nr:unnamed protein product [Meloidogyne enterolobii]
MYIMDFATFSWQPTTNWKRIDVPIFVDISRLLNLFCHLRVILIGTQHCLC